MDEPIRGSFPGGPKHSSPQPARRHRPRVESVGEIEAAMARRTVERQARRRRLRVVVGFVFALLAAGGLGAYIGFARHRSAEQLTAANNVQESRNLDISWQVNRTLLQLWQMEDVEALRDAGKAR
jgi:hypothetical protein